MERSGILILVHQTLLVGSARVAKGTATVVTGPHSASQGGRLDHGVWVPHAILLAEITRYRKDSLAVGIGGAAQHRRIGG